ncbi:polysaccharide pyruvyl transferase family protein [Marinoscillum sp. MHG1-6]|uniref:polysaccharide pyruvyl transferase family protein n=1 Tax=Marinoscillum sp. MHG1-6 TaxID=2959627 RepID=UPI0021571FB0|nr:polysaccharide pyruvyl transferase family protein [Marinoscillum sp. MHG1-6]
MNKKLKVGIIWANPYNPNLGVSALAYSAIALLDKSAKLANIPIELTIIGSSITHRDKVVLDGEEIEFDNIMAFDYFSIKSVVKYILNPRKYGLGRISTMNLILDVGEGDSFSDIYGNKRFYRILNSKIFLSLLKKRQILLPQTIGPFFSSKALSESKKALEPIDLIYARDEQSFEYAQENFPGKEINKSVDMAFLLPFQQRKLEGDLIKVGLNVSGLLWKGGYTQSNQFNLKVNYRDVIERIIEYFLGLGVELHIIPHVVDTSKSGEGDVPVCEEIVNSHDGLLLAPIFKSAIDAKSYIAGMDFFIGARMHSCIAAFSAGVPVFPMAYSRKFIGLFEHTLKYSFIGNCMTSNDEELIEGVKNAFLNRVELKNIIAKSDEDIIRPSIESLINEMAEELKK